MNGEVNEYFSALFAISKVYQPDSKDKIDSFICFIQCILDLIPDKDFTKHLYQYTTQYPSSLVIEKKIHPFLWVYKFYVFYTFSKKKLGINIKQEPYERFEEIYKEMTPTEWGRPCWFLIHKISSNLPIVIPKELQTSFKAFLVCLRFLLPCDKCRNHMYEYISTHKISPYIDNSDLLFKWTVDFHNAVNERLNKSKVSYEDALKMYRNNNYNKGNVKPLYEIIDGGWSDMI